MAGSARGDEPAADQRTRSCATELVCRDCDARLPLADTAFRCPGCGKGLDIDYDYELRQRAASPRCAPARAAPQHLALRGAAADRRRRAPRRGSASFSGHTPLIRADRLGAELGLRNLYLKDDSTNRPSPLLQGPRRRDGRRPRCWSWARTRSAASRPATSAPPIASLARQGGRRRLRLLPRHLEAAKARGCRALGAKVCQLDGNYDEANRACRELALSERHASSPTSPCARSTPRGRRRSPSRSSSSSTGARPTTSSCRPPAARSPRACTRAWTSWRWSAWRRPRATKHPHRPAERLLARSRRAILEGAREIDAADARDRSRTRWRSARPATATS